MVAFLLLLVSAPLVAAPSLAVDLTVTLILDPREASCAAMAPAMRQGLIDAFPVPGLRIGWRILDESTPEEQFERVVVVRFRESAPTQEGEALLDSGRTLGYVSETADVILPFISVDCGSVGHFLAEGVRDKPPARQRELVGRACGRVLAHELYHVLAQTAEHAKQGIAKPSFTAADLLDPGFRLSEESVRRIRSALAMRRRVVSPALLSFQ